MSQRTPAAIRFAPSVFFAAAIACAAASFPCAAQQSPPAGARDKNAPGDELGNPDAPGLREVFPHIRVDTKARIVELDARVPIRLDDPKAPLVYLELIACIPDTKEHEVLAVTEAVPSQVHTAMLLIDLKPGAPGSWAWEGDKLIPTPPTGDPVTVELVYTNAKGEEVVEPAWSWIKNLKTGETFPKGDWVFAGSRFVTHEGREWYDADGTGVLIGLTTFGSEVIAWPKMISPEASVEEPVWIADAAKTPPVDTPVIIRIKPAPKAK